MTEENINFLTHEKVAMSIEKILRFLIYDNLICLIIHFYMCESIVYRHDTQMTIIYLKAKINISLAL